MNSRMKWAGIVLSGIAVLPFFPSMAMKLMVHPGIVKGFSKYGIAESAIFPIGIVELLCVLIYLFPKTSVLGAILLTGYMGGAIIAHLIAGELFIVQITIGVLLWGGIYLRDARLRAILPLR